jgi:hypothetical protein
MRLRRTYQGFEFHQIICVFAATPPQAPWRAFRVSHARIRVNLSRQDSPPAWSTRLEAQRHREYPASARNVAGIPLPGVPVSIIPATPLGVIQRERGGGTWRSNGSPDLVLLLLNEFLQETVAFILGTCNRVNEINATFSSISRCLRVSSRTRRVVNPNPPIQGCLGFTRMRMRGIQTLLGFSYVR